MADAGSSIQVFVRVRPLNPRERSAASDVCVSVSPDGASISITAAPNAATSSGAASTPPASARNSVISLASVASANSGKRNSVLSTTGGGPVVADSGAASVKNTFAFDQCFQASADDSPGIDQERVFDAVARPLLDHAFTGYNVCLFAYGQTGSGKTYTMMGRQGDGNAGIIPRASAYLFDEIARRSAADPNVSFNVELSYLEIYCEKVKDLLNPLNKAKLRVREHPILGPYVEDLSKLILTSGEDLLRLVETGNQLRTVAATNMNDTSSRSHAVFQVILTQKRFDDETGMSSEKVSRISFVDLAGSERANSTGATGQRLKEGANINKSLTSLGKVISALADLGAGRASKNAHVPYRDSVLTWLLKDSLGGNSKTHMISCVSPASINASESLSTLRYSDRAKRIVNKAKVNEDPNAKLIADLKAEIELLRRKLMEAGSMGELGTGSGTSTSPPTGTASAAVSTAVSTSPTASSSNGGTPVNTPPHSASGSAPPEAISHLKDKLMSSEKLMRELNETWEEKLRRTQQLAQEKERVLQELGISIGNGHVGITSPKRHPHLLNQQPNSLNESLIYTLPPGKTGIGSATDAEVRLDKLKSCHAIIYNSDHVVLLQPRGPDIYVNSREVTKTTILQSGDQVRLQEYLFRFIHPRRKTLSMGGLSNPHLPRRNPMKLLTSRLRDQALWKRKQRGLFADIRQQCGLVKRANVMAKELGYNVVYQLHLHQEPVLGGHASAAAAPASAVGEAVTSPTTPSAAAIASSDTGQLRLDVRVYDLDVRAVRYWSLKEFNLRLVEMDQVYTQNVALEHNPFLPGYATTDPTTGEVAAEPDTATHVGTAQAALSHAGDVTVAVVSTLAERTVIGTLQVHIAPRVGFVDVNVMEFCERGTGAELDAFRIAMRVGNTVHWTETVEGFQGAGSVPFLASASFPVLLPSVLDPTAAGGSAPSPSVLTSAILRQTTGKPGGRGAPPLPPAPAITFEVYAQITAPLMPLVLREVDVDRIAIERSPEVGSGPVKHHVYANVQVRQLDENGFFVPCPVDQPRDNLQRPPVLRLRHGMLRRLHLTLASPRSQPAVGVLRIELGNWRWLAAGTQVIHGGTALDLPILRETRGEPRGAHLVTSVECAWDSSLHDFFYLNRPSPPDSGLLLATATIETSEGWTLALDLAFVSTMRGGSGDGVARSALAIWSVQRAPAHLTVTEYVRGEESLGAFYVLGTRDGGAGMMSRAVEHRVWETQLREVERTRAWLARRAAVAAAAKDKDLPPLPAAPPLSASPVVAEGVLDDGAPRHRRQVLAVDDLELEDDDGLGDDDEDDGDTTVVNVANDDQVEPESNSKRNRPRPPPLAPVAAAVSSAAATGPSPRTSSLHRKPLPLAPVASPSPAPPRSPMDSLGSGSSSNGSFRSLTPPYGLSSAPTSPTADTHPPPRPPPKSAIMLLQMALTLWTRPPLEPVLPSLARVRQFTHSALARREHVLCDQVATLPPVAKRGYLQMFAEYAPPPAPVAGGTPVVSSTPLAPLSRAGSAALSTASLSRAGSAALSAASLTSSSAGEWTRVWVVIRRPYILLYETADEHTEVAVLHLVNAKVEYQSDALPEAEPAWTSFALLTPEYRYHFKTPTHADLVAWVSTIDPLHVAALQSNRIGIGAGIGIGLGVGAGVAAMAERSRAAAAGRQQVNQRTSISSLAAAFFRRSSASVISTAGLGLGTGTHGGL
ncbi:hypothetical protein H9P43_008509 [Blastocladiella emersonii ATCC 22665]|nr:hypothetical protein H9P43_008509 [Blastocladiella emersonii ATCC 22665]